ncbi:MAG: PAS domain S-box protein [Methanoregulaceae archaeon]|nr:PAS domain S-box protein [Methanoregulaceae archaeon]
MEGDEIGKIKEILKSEPRGLSIRQITDQLNINRNLVAKYLDMLLVSGQVEMRTIGVAKMYYLSQRVPISALMDFSSDFIAVLDEGLHVLQINDNFLAFSGTAREEVAGKTIEAGAIPLLSSDEAAAGIRDALQGKETSIDIGWRNGDLAFHAKFIPAVFEDGRRGVTAILENTTEIRKAERSVRAALSEKEALLREINQRINDHLQLISSLVHLQISSTSDERARAVLVETQNRILSLAFVYAHLGQSLRLGSDPVGLFIRDLVQAIFQSYTIADSQVRTVIRTTGVSLSIRHATALGLIVNELVSYTIRTSFTGGARGDLVIEVSGDTEKGYMMVIGNTGKKFPAGLDPAASDLLGLQLAHTLAVKQLGGTISIRKDDGNAFIISFPGSME